MTEINHGEAAPPVGGFADIGGRRLFVHRTGEGGPPVVFIPGASAVGLDYLLILDGIAEITTGIVYDRGGTGFSDAMPLPRTCLEVATELHELLRAEDVEGPYVLVPHSLGGYYAHRFAQLFPDEVAGLVWLDATHCDWDRHFPPELQLAQSERMGADPAEMIRLRPQMRSWAEELYADFPATLRESLVELHLSDRGIRVGAVERGTQVAPAAEVAAGPALPDVPLIALTVVGSDGPQEELVAAADSPMTRDLNEGKIGLDAAMVARLSHGEQRVVRDVGHSEILFRRPDTVVEAIGDVIGLLRD